MSQEPYPNDEDIDDLADAHGLLATAGVAAGPDGYDMDTLAATTYGQGWSYRIDRAAGAPGYRVEVRPQHGAARQPLTSAVGWEPEVALAFALAKVLTPRDRQPGQPVADPAEAIVAE